MRILITGANGFVGKLLAARWLAQPESAGHFDELVLLDLAFSDRYGDPRVRCVPGDLSDPRVVREALRDEVDLVFHLACVPGRAAEEDYELGRKGNLFGTMELLDALRAQRGSPRVVFSSSAAVYGSPYPDCVDDATLPFPTLSYGCHKLMSEALIEEYTRRGWIDGLALRFAGVLARPEGAVANLSAFMNDVMHASRRGSAFVMPLGPGVSSWLASAPCCVDNLLHAAALPKAQLPARRTWMLPVLRISMTELVEGLATLFGPAVKSLVSFAPNRALEAIFGQPPLITAGAERLGFRHDGDVPTLIRRSLEAASYTGSMR